MAGTLSRRNRRIGVIVLIVALIVLLFAMSRMVTPEEWKSWVTNVSAPWLIVAFVFLPLFGFPVTLIYMAAGARFGFLGGMGLTVLCTIAHIVIGYFISHILHRPLTRLVDACGWKLPRVAQGATLPFAIWVALVPGISFAIKTYAVPLAGVSLRVLLLGSLPVYVAGAIFGLLLGRVAVSFSWPMIVGCLVYGVVLLFVTRWTLKRVRTTAVDEPPLQRQREEWAESHSG